MSGRLLAVIVLLAGTNSFAGVFSYEASSPPDLAGWEIVQLVCEPEQWVANGWFFQHVELCPGFPPPGGQEGTYRRTLDELIGESTFFLEWRMQTDGDRSELPWGGPSNLAAGSNGPVNYRFSIACDQVEINRDNLLPIILVDIEPGIPHTYRLELFGDTLYIWFIDGAVVASGVPEGAYPSFNPRITWRAKAAFLPNTTKWDYIRYGTIPQPASGDFNSDGVVDQTDVFFFVDCLLGPDADGPGCRWADMNGDTIADGSDIQLFAEAMVGP